jgi:C1A family cysteine protease
MPIKLETLQSQISKKGVDWVAGETPLANLSASEQQSRLGLDVSKDELAATADAIKAVESMQASFAAPAFTAPAAIDWRNNGGNYTSPVKDQSSCGSCVSFGTIGTIESRMNIACKNPNLDPDYSEAFLFYCGCGNCCPSGWNFAPALNFCQNTGVAKESAFPYTPGNQPCKPGVVPDFKISGWSSVLSTADRKNVLATEGPVVGGLAIFQDFYSYHSGVYRHVTGALVGYHAISVVGYDDNLKCWICKNSWGPSWGESGFFRIGYGECEIDTSFAFYNIKLTCQSQPVNQCEQYIPGLKSVLLAAQQNAQLRRCLRYHVCRRIMIPPICLPQYLALAQTINRILQLCPQYRKPFCDALG